MNKRKQFSLHKKSVFPNMKKKIHLKYVFNIMKNQFQLQKLKENDFYEPQKQFPIAGVRICIKCIF